MLRQLRTTRETIVLALIVPCMLEVILQQLFGRDSPVFQQVGTPLLGLFPFVTMFLVTSITMLRERTSGTLERLMTMPLHKVDLLAGYGIAFALLAVVQATLVSVLAFGVLGLEVAGPTWLVVVLAVANAVLGSTLGLFVTPSRTRNSRPFSSCPPWSSPRSSSADSSWRVRRWPRCCG